MIKNLFATTVHSDYKLNEPRRRSAVVANCKPLAQNETDVNIAENCAFVHLVTDCCFRLVKLVTARVIVLQ